MGERGIKGCNGAKGPKVRVAKDIVASQHEFHFLTLTVTVLSIFRETED